MFVSFYRIAPLLIALTLTALGVHAAERPDAARFFSLNTGDLRAELADARVDGKKGILLVFEQVGCPFCAFMRQHVLNRRDVQDFYRAHFVSFTVDMHGAVPLRDFAGRDTTEKQFAQATKVRATPTFVFYDLKGQEIARVVGALDTPQEFLLLGEFVASGAWRKGTFARYKAEMKTHKGD